TSARRAEPAPVDASRPSREVRLASARTPRRRSAGAREPFENLPRNPGRPGPKFQPAVRTTAWREPRRAKIQPPRPRGPLLGRAATTRADTGKAKLLQYFCSKQTR